MNIFDHPNLNNFSCPICKTNADKPVILVPIPDTEDGNIAEAQQYHWDCVKYFIVFYIDNFLHKDHRKD